MRQQGRGGTTVWTRRGLRHCESIWTTSGARLWKHFKRRSRRSDMPERQLMVDEATLLADSQELEPVRKSVRVKVDVARAFRVFTEEMDSWWPRTHHIGGSPMKRVVVEPRAGGASYTKHKDGNNPPG